MRSNECNDKRSISYKSCNEETGFPSEICKDWKMMKRKLGIVDKSYT
jgi:hypothetical protein